MVRGEESDCLGIGWKMRRNLSQVCDAYKGGEPVSQEDCCGLVRLKTQSQMMAEARRFRGDESERDIIAAEANRDSESHIDT